MTPAPRPTSDQPAPRRIRSAWRRLTGGRRVADTDRPTLIACSGGADSSALAFALASTPAPITLGHIVHDMRPREQAFGDRDAVRQLGERLGRPTLEAEVSISTMPGNAERNARVARYRALSELAARAGARVLVTAHHADDVLETMLMRLLRGSGPRGLRAIAPRLEPDADRPVAIVRPCLDLTREELESVCRLEGWAWREDATNTDESRARAALRARVLPELRRLWPEGARRAVSCAELCRDAQSLIESRANQLRSRASRQGGALVWSRDELRREPGVVLGELLAPPIVPTPLDPGHRRDIIIAIRDETTDPRCFTLRGATLRVLAREVRLEPDRA